MIHTYTQREICVSAHTYTHLCIYVYIYTHILYMYAMFTHRCKHDTKSLSFSLYPFYIPLNFAVTEGFVLSFLLLSLFILYQTTTSRLHVPRSLVLWKHSTPNCFCVVNGYDNGRVRQFSKGLLVHKA